MAGEVSTMNNARANPRIRKTLSAITAMLAGLFVYVIIVNRNAVDMSPRQKFLKTIYPIIMWFSGKFSKAPTAPKQRPAPPASIYALSATLNNGEPYPLAQLKGKRFMIVNTASDCGYTGQFEGLEKLYQRYKGELVILAFPANDFKQQEKGSDEAIAAFCKLNYGITFPLMKKSIVVKNAGQHEIFAWLTHKELNGWNDAPPAWNFSKYIIDEQGQLLQFFGPTVEPTSPEVMKLVLK